MKKKMMTAGLLIAVLAVWGMIIYRTIAAYSQSDDSDAVPETAPPSKVTTVKYDYRPDTAQLKLNYTDPFGISKRSDTSKNLHGRHTVARVIPLKTLVQKPAFDWSFIRYSGFITEGKSKVISVLTINGTTVMLTDGETANGVKLLKNLRDSVKISYNQQIKFIHHIAG